MSPLHSTNAAPLITLATALVFGATGCLSDYGSDCDRNVDLQCFWETRGGAGAAGGGGATATTTGEGGAGAAGGATMTTTVAPQCGDGTVDDGEACDDANTDDCDGCRGDCSAEETGCGDGFTCGDETCDDANSAAGDGCRDCRLECNTGTLAGGSTAAVYTDIPGQRCYVRVSASPKSWGAARTQCQTWKGDLFAFSDIGELAGVLGTLSGQNSVWTCGKGEQSPANFSWQNGEAWPPNVAWATGQPDSTDMECVEMLADGTLDDQSCSKLNGFLCERPLTAGP